MNVADAVAGIDPLDLDDGDLIEGCVVLVKVSKDDGTSSLHAAQSPGMSHWEQLGMLVDAADGLRGGWDDR